MPVLKFSSRFKKDLKRFRSDTDLLKKLEEFLDILIDEKKISPSFLNHKLKGQFKNCFECHLRPDVVLIYKINNKEVSILLLRIGSHSDLF